MTNNKSSNWFYRLINKIIKLFSSLFKRGTSPEIKEKAQETKVTITEVEQDVSPPIEIDEPECESPSRDSPSIENAAPSEDDRTKVSRETEMEFRSQSHTSSKEFRIPILQALVNLGGSAKRKSVFEELEKIMGDKLTENDWQTPPSKKKLTRWQTIATHTRTNLLNEDLLMSFPKKGFG
jgi:hypothetical protein